ncbi:hypothetical protein PAEPH01_2122 [Pancytospora epiphaga]|nr:hypothetical protein PAEPH01_2122 [Pancytospora epiphaga]
MGDFDNMSYEQAEMGLEELYIKYKCEAMSGYKRRKTHSFLFRNLEDGDCFLKAAVLRILIKIKRDIFSVDCDIFSLLESKDPRIRLIGRKLVKTFWSYYECDDAVVYAIHRHRMFYKMLKNNPKYKKIFSRRLTMWEEKVKTSKKLKKVEDHCRLESGSLYNALTEVNNCDELKQVLENYITKSSDNRKLILEYFIDKIIHYKSIESILIPGIGENETDGSKIDGEFKLELLGLKTRRLFKVIKGIYGRVTL